MTAVVDICNMALGHIGEKGINDVDEQSTQARACRLFYDNVRDGLLQSYPWRFAGETRALAAVTGADTGRWCYAYDRPNDCLKVRWIRPSIDADIGAAQTPQEEWGNLYEIEGARIFSDLSPVFLRYTKRVIDPTLYPALFTEALAWALAVRLAMPLIRDAKVRADAYQVATLMRGQAEMADANEVRETSDHASDLVEARA